MASCVEKFSEPEKVKDFNSKLGCKWEGNHSGATKMKCQNVCVCVCVYVRERVCVCVCV